MRFSDLNECEDNLLIETDLCIVGSGPAGLSIAKEFAGTKIKVWILESGGFEKESDTEALCKIENVGVSRKDNTRNRLYGGTSHTWTGRCAPFNPTDFQKRSWIPYSGWDLKYEELEPLLERAGKNLGLGPNCYDNQLWKLFKVLPATPNLDSKFLDTTFWQFSKSPKERGEPIRFGRDFFIDNSPNIEVLLHANVTHINTNELGTCFESVEVRTLEGKRAFVKAKALVLSCGGIENARLLLASNRTIPNGIGNQNDVVGRFLMDHSLCVIGSFDHHAAYSVRNRFGHYLIKNKQRTHVYLHGLSLSPKIQEQENLLRCDAYLEEYNPLPNDSWSAMRRLKTTLRKRECIKQSTQDIFTILSNFREISSGFHRRYVKRRPPLLKVERLELHCMLEQLPDPESRITLSTNQKDRLNMPLAKINWKVNSLERQTAQRMSQLITQEFQRIGFPAPHLSSWLNKEENWTQNFEDKAHHTGTTRMSANPKKGVVNVNSQVHEVNGLFVAGSSTFPTSGTANSTLMIVALALRLADHLKYNYFRAS
ncbi:GMC oxidoreductase [Brasilonema bromeliae]|uniref:GMC family oxidoreductase n=1 Tax=Brasilonema bromeliae SPC951 TaxID=385972 RepID=A0ABX1P989_9CYAN|nr:GMC family oxidoreductase [Brasilonema bromeliae]NMG20221.1 GMC family oxidoreductase [Brasilonema bromeliae SPC951]